MEIAIVLSVLLFGALFGGWQMFERWKLEKAKRADLEGILEKGKLALQERNITLSKKLAALDAANIEIREKDRALQEANRMLNEKKEELVAAEIEKLNYELSPHAFKNTLNTIKSLSLRTHEAVDRLTGLLDYMLYDIQENYVELGQELEFLEKFVGLHKLMLPSWVKLKLDLSKVSGEFSKNYLIAPLITVYFAENAFKHAFTNDPKSYINFEVVKVSEDEIAYKVTNLVTHHQPKNPKSGIGSKNLQKRLDLLYPGKYKLDAYVEADRYVAMLTLKLKAV